MNRNPYLVTYLPATTGPCEKRPCGQNAICKERNNAASCTCIPDYFGDPYVSCQPECLTNSECSLNTACINNKCKNPCIGACSPINAECYVASHKASCNCKHGFTGDPFNRCTPLPSKNQFLLTLTKIHHV